MTTKHHAPAFTALASIFLALSASGAFASLSAVRISSPYGFDGAIISGQVVAVDPDGNVYVAGHYFNATTFDMVVCRLDRATLGQKWSITRDEGGIANNVRAMAVDSSNVYVCGMGAAGPNDGFITAFRSSDGAYQWSISAGLSDGFYGIAIDPVEGILLAVGTGGTGGSLARYTRTGDLLDQNDYSHPAMTSYGKAIAVTGEHIYIGGNALSGSLYPWVYCMDRSSRTKVYSKVFMAMGNKTVVSLAPVGANICALIADTDAGNGELVMLDPSGTEIKRKPLYSLYDGPTPILPQQVVAHPTLPLLLVVAGYQRNILTALDFDLNVLWSTPAIVPSEGAATMEWISGVAVTSGMNSAVYVVGQQMLAGPTYKLRAGGFRLENPAIAGEKLVVAPNRLELSGAIRQVSIIVRGSENKDVSVQVFDAAGRIVKTIKGISNSNGVFEARWDGTGGTSGILQAPGLYWVRIEGGKEMKALLLTTEDK